MTDAIRICALQKSFCVEGRSLEVLRGLELTVPAHQITVVLGRSGCGKTTLLRLIGGLDRDYSGSIQKSEGTRTAFVFQEPRLMPWLTVAQNIAFGLKKRAVRPGQIEKLIELTGLDGFANALPSQLSGGMRQRVALARALALEPDFILMDEPFAALDHFTRGKMQQALLDIQKSSRCGVLFVTHSIEEAMNIADHIVVLEDKCVKKEYALGSAWRETCSEEERRALRDDILSSIQI